MTEKPPIVFNRKFQSGLVVQLISDYDFLRNTIDDLHESYFDSSLAIIKLLKLVKSIHKLTNKPLTVDIVRNSLAQLTQAGTFTEPESSGILEILDLGSTITFSEKEYIKNQAYEFLKHQTIAKAVSESISHLDAHQYDPVYEKITSAYKKTFSVGEDLGFNYKDSCVDDRYSVPPRSGMWSSGFPKLDTYIGGGFASSECYTVISATGRGKTSLLSNFAVTALSQSKNVLFITLEMTKEQIAYKQDSIISGLCIDHLAGNRDLRRILDESIMRLPGQSVIKYFPRGRLTVSRLRTFIERFGNEVFEPNVIILDWFGCLKLGGDRDSKKHELLAEAADEVINMTRDFSCTGLTAHQSNRSAVSQDIFDYGAVSESFASLFGMDIVFGLGATNEAKDAGKRTLTLLKNRFGPDSVYTKLQGDSPGQPMTFKFREAPDEEEESDLLKSED